jgi:hypothetical protein
VLTTGTSEAVESVARDIIAALHGNLLDRICHVFDRDLDKSVGDFFCLATADLLRKFGERIAHRVRVERKILRRAENLREEFRDKLADHYVGVGDRQGPIAPVAFRSRIGASGIGSDAEAGPIEMQDRTSAGGDRVDQHHRRAHTYAGDLGFECALVFAIKVRNIRRRAAHVEADEMVQSGLPTGLGHADNAACGPGKDRVLALEQVGRRQPAG